MDEDLGGLLVLGKIAALKKTSGSRVVHEEIRGSVQFNEQTAEGQAGTLGVADGVSRLEGDIFDVRKRILDLVAGGAIVDVVSDAGLVGRVEDDQIHCTLTDTAPGTNGKRAAGKVLYHNLRVGFGMKGDSISKRDAVCGSGNEFPSERIARFHGLHRKISAHRFRNVVAILAALDALLRNVLYFGPAILKPDLHGAFGHVDFLGDSVSHLGRWGRVLLELEFQGDELFLRRPLALLILLLLSESALARRFTSRRRAGRCHGRGRG